MLDTVDPYQDVDADYLAYIERNRACGAMPGQVRIRIRYGERVTPWFDLLLVSPSELDKLTVAPADASPRSMPGDPPDFYASTREGLT